MHRAGVIDVEAKITAHGEACRLGDADLADVAHQQLPHTHEIGGFELRGKLRVLTAPAHARQHRRKLRLHAHHLRQLRVLDDLAERDVQNRRRHREHFGRDLRKLPDKDAEHRLARHAVVERGRVVGV